MISKRWDMFHVEKGVLKGISLLSLLAFLITLSGCTSVRLQTQAFLNLDTDLIGSNYKAADKLIDRALPPLVYEQPILVATFVNINDLEKSSPLGRTISEQVASRFTQQGYKIVQMKLRNAVYMKRNDGEFLLSREVRNISAEHNAQYVVVGTYSAANYVVYVSSSVIRLSDNRVVSTYDYDLPLGANNLRLLRAEEEAQYTGPYKLLPKNTPY
jgi:TolB-like protein